MEKCNLKSAVKLFATPEIESTSLASPKDMVNVDLKEVPKSLIFNTVLLFSSVNNIFDGFKSL